MDAGKQSRTQAAKPTIWLLEAARAEKSPWLKPECKRSARSSRKARVPPIPIDIRALGKTFQEPVSVLRPVLFKFLVIFWAHIPDKNHKALEIQSLIQQHAN